MKKKRKVFAEVADRVAQLAAVPFLDMDVATSDGARTELQALAEKHPRAVRTGILTVIPLYLDEIAQLGGWEEIAMSRLDDVEGPLLRACMASIPVDGARVVSLPFVYDLASMKPANAWEQCRAVAELVTILANIVCWVREIARADEVRACEPARDQC